MVLLVERLEELLPPLARTPVNDRTVFVCRRCWIDNLTVADVALEQGWSVPAVEWHLRRAEKVLDEAAGR